MQALDVRATRQTLGNLLPVLVDVALAEHGEVDINVDEEGA